ncbi:hypothetical protein [Burkholderia pyrrocinia]|uniref:hypothetical protein n=1 Tax=Burkholderia pyrrocinia TaxID=60550 RepID=UPI0020C67C92|nr:hypothetical protein [Burkholderia pyrrocinia]
MLVNLASVELVAALLGGKVDIAVVEQAASEPGGECLRTERLMWVGASGGNAYMKRPLAVSIVSDACVIPAGAVRCADEARYRMANRLRKRRYRGDESDGPARHGRDCMVRVDGARRSADPAIAGRSARIA